MKKREYTIRERDRQKGREVILIKDVLNPQASWIHFIATSNDVITPSWL
jgi:adenylosuccinate lyase